MAINVKMTKLQWEEATHKLYIISEEPDLQESYDLTQDQAQALYDRFYYLKPVRGSYKTTVTFSELDILIGEMENCMEIASANIDHGDTTWMGYRASIGRFLKIMKAEREKFLF